MTDKQIIIDGVDVSGCIYYDNGKCLNDEMVQCSCKKVAVCYYKEYKRKEQECEGLKELVKKQKDVLIHKTILADEYEKAYSFENLKVAKLKYCLAEIKEIAEKCCIMQATLDCENYDDCTQCGRISDGEGIQQILQKISEVENG